MASWLPLHANNNRLITQEKLLRMALSQHQSERRPSVVPSIAHPVPSCTVREILDLAIEGAKNLRMRPTTSDGSFVQSGDARSDACRETPGDLPTKLYAILANAEYEHIISWMPHGYAWKIKDLNLFLSEILPVFVDGGSYPSNFDAFVRLLKSYGFKQLTRGPDTSAYYHELFLRGIPHLHGLMRPLLGSDHHQLHNPESEPSFLNLRPLPRPARSSPTIFPVARTAPATTPIPVPVVFNQILTRRVNAVPRGTHRGDMSAPLSILPQKPPMTVAGPSTTNRVRELSSVDALHMDKLRAAQHLHRQHLKHLEDARLLADLHQSPTPTSLPLSTKVKDVEALASKEKSKIKKKSARRKWLPPLGPPTPVTPPTSAGSGNGKVAWYLTNPEVFAALSEISLPSK